MGYKTILERAAICIFNAVRYFFVRLLLGIFGPVFCTSPVFAQSPGFTFSTSELTVTEGSTAMLTVRLNTQPTANVSMFLRTNDSDAVSLQPLPAPPSIVTKLVFTTMNWNQLQTFTVVAEQDDDESYENVNLRVSTFSSDLNYNQNLRNFATVTVRDDDAMPGMVFSSTALTMSEGNAAMFTVRLNTQPTAPVDIAVSSPDETAVTVSPARLGFTDDDWNTLQTVTVSAVEDSDTDSERLSLGLAPSSGDQDYNGTTSTVAVTVADNDAPGVTFSTTALTIDEGSTATFTARLNTRQADTSAIGIESHVTLTMESDDTEAVTVSPALRFTRSNWDMPQTLTVRAIEDSDMSFETVGLRVRLAGADRDYRRSPSLTDNRDITVTVRDDDATPGVTFSSTALTVTEGDTVDFTVRLNTRPTHNVSFFLRTNDASIVGLVVPPRSSANPEDSMSLTFTAMNWSTLRTLRVRAEADADANNERVGLRYQTEVR